MSSNFLLVSIQPEYATKIFNGEKTVELRRVRPKLAEGDLVLVYASYPTKALIGIFEVEDIIQESPQQLWNIVKEKAAISHKKFDIYYQGASVGYGICLRKTHQFQEPIELERLREHWSGFRPPQCYRYLNPEEVNIVASVADCKMLNAYTKLIQNKFEQLALFEQV